MANGKPNAGLMDVPSQLDVDDLTAEVADGTVLSNILDDDGDSSSYDRTKHSLFAIGSDTDTIITNTSSGRRVAIKSTGDLTSFGTSLNLFTVTGDVLVRVGASVDVAVTSTSGTTTGLTAYFLDAYFEFIF